METAIEQLRLAFSCLCRFGVLPQRLPKSKSFSFYLVIASALLGGLVAFIATILIHLPFGGLFTAIGIPLFSWWLDRFRSVTSYLQFIEKKLPSLPSPLKTEQGKLFWQFYLFAFLISLRFLFTYLLVLRSANTFWLMIPFLFNALLFVRYLYWPNLVDYPQDIIYTKIQLLILVISVVAGLFIGKILTVFLFVFLLLGFFEYALTWFKRLQIDLSNYFVIICEWLTLILLLLGALILG